MHNAIARQFPKCKGGTRLKMKVEKFLQETADTSYDVSKNSVLIAGFKVLDIIHFVCLIVNVTGIQII